jgi:hypothetical protein
MTSTVRLMTSLARDQTHEQLADGRCLHQTSAVTDLVHFNSASPRPSVALLYKNMSCGSAKRSIIIHIQSYP